MALIFPIDVDLRDAISYLRIPHGAAAYGPKGGDDRDLDTMLATWHDPAVSIPTEAELQAALDAVAAARAAKAATRATEVANLTKATNALSRIAVGLAAIATDKTAQQTIKARTGTQTAANLSVGEDVSSASIITLQTVVTEILEALNYIIPRLQRLTG